jgi:flagellar biosynthesis anti-sigma factor FlgM
MGIDMLDMEMLREAIEEHKIRKRSEKDLGKQRPETRDALKKILTDPEMAGVVEKIQSIVTNTPEVRQAKVDEIKKQIDAGTLNVDSRQLAEKMLQETILEELL